MQKYISWTGYYFSQDFLSANEQSTIWDLMDQQKGAKIQEEGDPVRAEYLAERTEH